MSDWADVHIRQKIELGITIAGSTMQFSGIIIRKNDKEAYLPMPQTSKAAEVLKPGVKVEAKIYLGEEVMKFETSVAQIVPGNPPQVVINRPAANQVESKKQSSGFELKEKIPLEYRFLKNMTTPVSDFKPGFTESISATDMTIVTSSALRTQNQVEINLKIKEDNIVNFVASCSGESKEKEQGNRQVFETDIHIEMINPGEQDKIVKLIFKKQSSLRRRGMV